MLKHTGGGHLATGDGRHGMACTGVALCSHFSEARFEKEVEMEPSPSCSLGARPRSRVGGRGQVRMGRRTTEAGKGLSRTGRCPEQTHPELLEGRQEDRCGAHTYSRGPLARAICRGSLGQPAGQVPATGEAGWGPHSPFFRQFFPPPHPFPHPGRTCLPPIAQRKSCMLSLCKGMHFL